MKITLLLFAILFSNLVISQIPVFEWAANLQWVNTIIAKSVTTDSSNNVIVTGTFSSWTDMDPGPAELLIQSVGVEDVFIMKLDQSGNLLWVKTLGSINSEKPYSVITDSLDNVYVFGEFESALDLDPGAGTYNLTAAFFKTGFLISLDPLGNFRWALQVSDDYTINYEQKNKLAYTSDGGILLSENFTGTVDFDPGPGTFNLTASGSYSAYIWKLDLNGGLMWAKAIVGGVNDTQGAEVNGAGEIFVTGRFTGTPDFDPGVGTTTVSSNGASLDAFVLKLDVNGDFIWVKTFGGTALEHTHDLAADDSGNVYVSGYYDGPADLDPGVGEFNVTPVGNTEDNFVLKLDAQGDFVWALTYPFELFNYLPSLDTDADGNVYIASNFRDSIDIVPGAAVHKLFVSPSSILTSNVDFYFSKLSPSGSLIWVKQIGGEFADYIYDVHIAPGGEVHVVGIYDETVDFNPGYGNAIYSSIGSFDAFNVKYSQCTQTAPLPNLMTLSDVTSVCYLDTLIPPTASEFCLGTITGIPDVTFPIDVLGNTTITWTYDAGNGFLTTQTQLVTIIDTTAPQPTIANLPNVNAVCSINSLTPPTATDACSGSVIITNNATFPILSNTTVTWTYDDGNGNTTTQLQQINIQPIDNTINQMDAITLNASASGYSYQWLDCTNGNAPVNGATAQTFIATENGSYAAEISNGVCTVVSDCITISEVGLTSNTDALNWILAPNPSIDGVFIIQMLGADMETTITVLNELGQVVDCTLESSELGYTIRLSSASGIYFLRITSSEHTVLLRLVKG